MGCLGCDKTCACFVVAGTGIVVTGTGNAGSPYTINAIGASEYTDDTCSIAISGDGTIGTPLTADAILNAGGCLVCTADLGLGVVTDPAGCIECGEDGLTLFLDPDAGIACTVTGLGIVLDPDVTNTATLGAAGLLVVSGGGTVSADDPITGDGSGGSPLALALAAAGGLEVAGGDLQILLDPATDAACGSLSAAGLLISCGGAGGGGLYTVDNADAFIDAFGAASAYDCEFDRTTNPTTVPTNWVWQNQRSATYLEQLGHGHVSIPTGSNDIANITCLVQPVSAAASYDAQCHVYNVPYVGVSLGICSGMILTDGTKGAGILWNTNPLLLFALWDNVAGGYNSNPTTLTIPEALADIGYWRIVKNSSSDYDFLWSRDGYLWNLFTTAYDVGAFMTPTHFGFLFSQATGACEYAVDWFRVR